MTAQGDMIGFTEPQKQTLAHQGDMLGGLTFEAAAAAGPTRLDHPFVRGLAAGCILPEGIVAGFDDSGRWCFLNDNSPPLDLTRRSVKILGRMKEGLRCLR